MQKGMKRSARGDCHHRRAPALVKQQQSIAQNDWERGCDWAARLLGLAFGLMFMVGIIWGW